MKNTIKVERAKKNITQEELAKMTDVSRQTINAIETKRYTPSAILAIKIAGVFEVSVHDIFELEEND
ncbi:MAG: helix-turn-helix transcriptional regulator [Bacteroidetes bacterium]|nr:helix-turn-helix transcriptional regulator [Bacteroidota bacterium]